MFVALEKGRCMQSIIILISIVIIGANTYPKWICTRIAIFNQTACWSICCGIVFISFKAARRLKQKTVLHEQSVKLSAPPSCGRCNLLIVVTLLWVGFIELWIHKLDWKCCDSVDIFITRKKVKRHKWVEGVNMWTKFLSYSPHSWMQQFLARTGKVPMKG